jgi:hypothetical protein
VPCKGKVANAGQALQVSNPMVGWVEVTFTAIGEDGKAKPGEKFSARADQTGAFTIPGRLGKGLTPGKYRIAVRQWDPYPQTDKLNGKFDENNTKITREVGKGDLDIDLSKPGG